MISNDFGKLGYDDENTQLTFIDLEITSAVLDAFAAFNVDKSLLALPIVLKNDVLLVLPPIQTRDAEAPLQTALNEVEFVLDHRTPMYLILRQNNSATAITYIPYLAKEHHRAYFLDHRHELVEQLGKEHFAQSLICKEKGEIIDARAWQERDRNKQNRSTVSGHLKDGEECEDGCEGCGVKDSGYERTKCRLCDRRMQYKIVPEALEALKTLSNPGNIVQIVSARIPRETTALTSLARRHRRRNTRPRFHPTRLLACLYLLFHLQHLVDIHHLPPH